MKKQINTTTRGFSAHVDFEDLEKLGWDFSELYENVAWAKDMPIDQAEAWEKENYHVRIFNNGHGLKWIPSHNTNGDTGDCQDAGDAHEHIVELYNSAKLWEVFEGETAEA